jgi:hypothetical protein
MWYNGPTTKKSEVIIVIRSYDDVLNYKAVIHFKGVDKSVANYDGISVMLDDIVIRLFDSGSFLQDHKDLFVWKKEMNDPDVHLEFDEHDDFLLMVPCFRANEAIA